MAARSQAARVALACCDGAAIVAFVTIGLFAHRRGLSVGGYARDVLPLAGAWFAVAWFVGLYRQGGPARLAATWALGIPVGVLVRALVLGHRLDGSEAAFLGVCLATIGLLSLALRGAVALAASPRLRPLAAAVGGRARPQAGGR